MSRRRAIVVLLVFLAIGISGSVGWYFLSTPSELVTVPDLRGQTISEASRTVGSDFELDQRAVKGNGQSLNTVVAQDPAPNEQVSKGSVITVDRSSGAGSS